MATLLHYLKLFVARSRGEGFTNAVKYTLKYLRGRIAPDTPLLARVDQDVLFAQNTEIVRKKEKKLARSNSILFDSSRVAANFPEVYTSGDRIIRYAYKSAEAEAEKESNGLVLIFHGFNTFVHLSGKQVSPDFDILAPWDTFGWNRQGSWFWGEKGDNFVEEMLWELIQKVRADVPDKPWFCMGSSMGGFAALYYGIKYHADGMYVMAPQVDLKLKAIEYGADNRDNPYGYLRNDSMDSFPDLFELAEKQEALPPLFLIQNQYDAVNVFAKHGFRLLDIYNRKNAWYGVRVYPAIGHGGDGSYEEAFYFFKTIVQKRPQSKTAFSFA